jgi:hypothetical protein
MIYVLILSLLNNKLYDQKLASDSTGLSGGFRGIGCGFKKMGARQLSFELV